MKKIRLTESDLVRIIKRTINEMEFNSAEEVANQWYERTGNDFYLDFISNFPTIEQFNEVLVEQYLNDDEYDPSTLENSWSPEDEANMLKELFPNYPGDEEWFNFNDDLNNAGW